MNTNINTHSTAVMKGSYLGFLGFQVVAVLQSKVDLQQNIIDGDFIGDVKRQKPHQTVVIDLSLIEHIHTHTHTHTHTDTSLETSSTDKTVVIDLSLTEHTSLGGCIV